MIDEADDKPCDCAHGPVYKFDRPCCVARWLLMMPRAQRKGWFARITFNRGEEFAERIKEEVKKLRS